MSALVLALAVAMGTSAAPVDDPWITIDRDVLIAFETGVEPALAPASSALSDPLGIRPDVIAVPMSEERMGELAEFIHERYRRCGGFISHPSREEAYASAARAATAAEMEQAVPTTFSYKIDNGPVAMAMVNAVQEMPIRQTITDLSAFFTRYHACPSAQQSAQYIRDKWQAMATAAGRTDVTVRYFDHSAAPSGWATPQPSVILRIPGTSPTVGTEYIVLGAHQDSVAGSNCTTSRSPGADDDASGVATLTEIIRVAMQLGFRPQRTVEFMAYAAEEVGLRGSNHIAQSYGSVPVNVIGVLQFDMTNYAAVTAAKNDIVIFTDFTTITQNDFLQQLAAVYVPRAYAYAPRPTSQCGYGCSDHASWFDRGYAASFPFEAPFNQHSPFIHTANDTLAQSGGHAQRTVPFAKLGAVYMAELAKGTLVPLAPVAPKGEAQPRARTLAGRSAR
jgi:bacterial leucyl aminopeptidase